MKNHFAKLLASTSSRPTLTKELYPNTPRADIWTHCAPGQRLSGEEIDKTRLVEGYCSRFCSSQIEVFPNTPPEEPERNREDRIAQGLRLIRWANGKAVDLQSIKGVIEDGFGHADVGEDQFDAVVGLLGMLAVILGVRNDGAPMDHSTRSIEGWILGQRSHA